MKRYEITKWNENGIVSDYGSFTDYEDIKALTKGYTYDEEMFKKFGLNMYMRKNSKTYYMVDVIEY